MRLKTSQVDGATDADAVKPLAQALENDPTSTPTSHEFATKLRTDQSTRDALAKPLDKDWSKLHLLSQLPANDKHGHKLLIRVDHQAKEGASSVYTDHDKYALVIQSFRTNSFKCSHRVDDPGNTTMRVSLAPDGTVTKSEKYGNMD